MASDEVHGGAIPLEDVLRHRVLAMAWHGAVVRLEVSAQLVALLLHRRVDLAAWRRERRAIRRARGVEERGIEQSHAFERRRQCG